MKLSKPPFKKLNNHLTLGILREILYKNPTMSLDTPILVQRVEDSYFENKGSGWSENSLIVEDPYMPGTTNQYSQAWCAFYDEEREVICLDIHY